MAESEPGKDREGSSSASVKDTDEDRDHEENPKENQPERNPEAGEENVEEIGKARRKQRHIL